MTGYKKRTVILVISLIALLGPAGCGQSGGGNGSGENLTKEQKIDKGLDAFYNLDDGKVQIEAKTDYIRHQPSEGQKQRALISTRIREPLRWVQLEPAES